MIPAGTYRARACAPAEAQFGYTAKGTEQIAVALTLIGPPFEGQVIYWFGYFTDKANEQTIKALRTCGWTGDDLNDLAGLDANEVDLVIEEETDDQGRVRSRVRWINAPGGGKVKLQNTMTPEQRAAFAKRMRGNVKAADAAASSSAPRKAAVKADAVAHGAVDEVPF